MNTEKKANRRLVGFAMIGSAVLMTFLAGLIFTGVIDIAGDARPMVGGVLGTVAALDLVLAVYFIVSEPS